MKIPYGYSYVYSRRRVFVFHDTCLDPDFAGMRITMWIKNGFLIRTEKFEILLNETKISPKKWFPLKKNLAFLISGTHFRQKHI